MKTRIRKLSQVGCVLALGLSFSLGATPSSAAVGKLTCLGKSTVTYSPGLTNTPQTVTITSTNTFPKCFSSDHSITSAHIETSVHTGVRSCTDLLKSGSGPLTLVYNNSESTTYDSHFSANYLLGQLVVADSGPVTSGKFTGSTASGLALYLADLSQCGTSQGLTNLNGSYLINIH